MKLKRRNNLVAGTSLIELLVVIVVFLIGILAIAQIFPGGFKILSVTRAETVANGLAHSEMDRLRVFANGLPEQIVPVTYSVNSGNLVENITDISPNEFGPAGNSIQLSSGQPSTWGLFNSSGAPLSTWDVFGGAVDLGPWQLLSGANNIRHVVGEGSQVPAPRLYNPPPTSGSPVAPSINGCLLKLQFAPILPLANPPYLPAASTLQPTVSVYGNDLQKNIGPPAGQLFNTTGSIASPPATNGEFVVAPYAVPTYNYYWDDSTPSAPFLYVPVNGANVTGQAQPRYRVTFAAQINTGTSIVGRTVVLPSLTIPNTSTAPSAINETCYCALSMAQFVNSGESLISIDYNSVRVARDYDDITKAFFTGSPTPQTFDSTVNPDGTPRNPYQYIVVNSSLGLILVNPAAYGYIQQSIGGSAVALQARVDYDIYDWRVLKEDFRLPETTPFQYQLKLTNIKHQFGAEADSTSFAGIPSGGAANAQTSVLILDEDTGGLVASTAFTVNYHTGILTFTGMNGATIPETFLVPPPGTPLPIPATTPWVQVTNPSPQNANQHTFRVYYMGVGEWATQVTKGAANYLQVSAAPPMPGQFFVAPAAVNTGPASSSTCNNQLNINFARVDVGQTVSFDELWYQRTDGTLQCARGQSAQVKLVGGVPLVLISDIDPLAKGADFSNGYAARGVKGTSILVREFWNPNSLNFSNKSGANNLTPFNQWENGWRVISTQAILDKGTLQ